MSAIKKFFEKRKLNVKFKKAGEGHRLAEDSPSTSRPHANTSQASQRNAAAASAQSPEAEAARRAAAQAALARVEAKQQSRTADGLVIQRARMKRDMEQDKKRIQEAEAQGAAAREGPVEVIQDCAPVLESVLFTCPDVGPMVLPKAEMEAAIHQFLLDNLEDEPEMTSALLIHTLNKNNREKVKVCIDTLIKYLDNIINNPTEEKFWKIRQNNKAFQERVACMGGTSEFLFAAGFSLKSLPFEDGEAMFYVFDSELAKDVERLQNMKDVLLQAEPLRPQLDRALRVFHPSQAASKFEVPGDFYAISPQELKKEQQRKEEATEKLGMLRTKAMRERDEQRELRKYRYTLLRIRFPDGVMLQGVFRAVENMSNVYAFVRENLANDWIPFNLASATGHKLEEGEKGALAELGLAPAAVINFSWDASVMKEVIAQQGQVAAKAHLKPEILSLIQTL